MIRVIKTLHDNCVRLSLFFQYVCLFGTDVCLIQISRQGQTAKLVALKNGSFSMAPGLRASVGPWLGGGGEK